MMRKRRRYLVGFVGFLLLCAVGLMVISLQRDVTKAKTKPQVLVHRVPHGAADAKAAARPAL